MQRAVALVGVYVFSLQRAAGLRGVAAVYGFSFAASALLAVLGRGGKAG